MGNRRTASAIRGPCPIHDFSSLRTTALVPKDSWGLTVSSHPTFWFYIPKPNKSERIPIAEFILLSDNERIILHKSRLRLPEQSGIINIKIEYPLEIGKRYIWYFNVSCGSRDNLSSVFINGRVERVRPKAYADNQIWYDLLTNIANRLINSRDTKSRKDWTSLLKDIGLSDFAEQPLLPCCTSDKSL
ncbi:DUF928 domain-containing protein [Brasilonema sp. CT11]|nr:DUF928 domain-containing protein [Brasilonema sp. CT11]